MKKPRQTNLNAAFFEGYYFGTVIYSFWNVGNKAANATTPLS
jgi:hypothetical protein